MTSAAPSQAGTGLRLAPALRRLLLVAVLAYLGAAGFMTVFQRSFLYRPAPAWIDPASQNIPRAERASLTAADGTPLSGWWIPPTRDDQPVYLYFHGNADGLDRRARRFALMTAEGAGLLAMSYRGYGGSGGSPSEAAIHADAELAHADLARRFALRRIVIVGESLGSGVALNLARKVEAGAVILDSPYLSVLYRAQSGYPWLPVAWLLSDSFRSDRWIAETKAPVLILHGDGDRLIPPSDSEKLAARARPGTVTRKLYPGIGHVVPWDRGPHLDVPAFLAGLKVPP